MLINKALKVRLYPTIEQQEFLDAQFGAIRFVYNKSLHIKNHYYKRGVKLNPIKDIKPLLSKGKSSRKYSWLKQYDSLALQESVRNLNKAFTNFFDKSLPHKFPKFKKKYDKQSSYHCSGIQVFDDSIKIPKLKDNIPAIIHRQMEGKLASITLSKSKTGKYYASILYAIEKKEEALPHTFDINKILGVDIGLTHFLIDSNGNKIVNPKFLNNGLRNLRIKNKNLSRKQKGSKNRIKAKLRLAKSHEDIANRRKDFFFKLAQQLVNENQVIIVETLKIKNMLKNRRLARHIIDAGWSMFLTILENKCKEHNVVFIKIDQWYASSKTCSCCGHKLDELDLSIRFWECPKCKAYHDRDINAALNIKQEGILEHKAAGHVVTVCGGGVKLDDSLEAACETENRWRKLEASSVNA